MFDVVVLHVSEPYSRTDLTLVLKILILLWRERAEEFQMGRRVLHACLALLILVKSIYRRKKKIVICRLRVGPFSEKQ